VSQDWLGQRERSNRLACRWIVWVALHFGRAAARGLLYPICGYYLLFSPQARASIRAFLSRVLARRIGWRDLFRHYYCFAATVLDRVYLLRGQYDLFDIDLRGAEIFTECLARGQGCLLLGAHLGSFEIVRATGFAGGFEVRILMHEENAPMIRDIMRDLNPTVAETVIPAGAPDTMLKVKECVDRGGMIGVLGDRSFPEARIVPCVFLGEPAGFPAGTMRLAHVLRVPVLLFFGLYRGGNHYEIHFEWFAEEVNIDRAQRDQDLQRWTQRYVDRLEYYCRLAPDNWFNFYDFWGEKSYGSAAADPSVPSRLLATSGRDGQPRRN